MNKNKKLTKQHIVAINNSIKHWEELRGLENIDIGMVSCALCEMISAFVEGCGNCPIYWVTGRLLCGNTPYGSVVITQKHTREKSRVSTWDTDEDFICWLKENKETSLVKKYQAACQKEIDFLAGLVDMVREKYGKDE